MIKAISKVFIIASSLGFWYLILPTSYLSFILWSMIYIVVGIPLYLTAFYLQVAMVRTLRKRSKTLRKLIINPPRY